MRYGFVDRQCAARLCLISGLVVIADQAAKFAIQSALALYETVPVIKGVFSITHILNTGGAFGIFAGHSQGLRNFIFLFISSMVAAVILWIYRRTCRDHVVLSSGIALIFGGAVGNLIDRFRQGSVVDFLDFYINDLHWPAFNIADSAISIGMIVFLYHILFNKIPDL